MFHSYIIELHAQAIAVTSYCLEEAFPTSSSTGTLDFGSACRACSDMFRSICYLNWLFRSVPCNSFDTSSYDHQRIQPNQLNPPWSPPSLPLENRWIRSEVPIRPVPPAAVSPSARAHSLRPSAAESRPPPGWHCCGPHPPGVAFHVSCSTHETGWLFEQ